MLCGYVRVFCRSLKENEICAKLVTLRLIVLVVEIVVFVVKDVMVGLYEREILCCADALKKKQVRMYVALCCMLLGGDTQKSGVDEETGTRV